MLRVVCIIGPPASGKTTLMNKVIKSLGKSKLMKIQTLQYHEFKQHKCAILGRYIGEEFEGTDRLSMSVQPVAIKVLDMWSKNPKFSDWTILFEGDRLGTKSFLKALQGMEVSLKIYLLKVDGDELDQRHKDRDDNQGETWLKGRLTKLQNICEAFDGSITVLRNTTKLLLHWNRDQILEQIGGYC